MQKHRREIPFSAFLAARAACRALAEAASGAVPVSPHASSWFLPHTPPLAPDSVSQDAADDDVVVMTIN